MSSSTLRSIALIGPSGSGKSTVARLLAEKLGWRWVDLDAAIESHAGMSVAAIFAQEGEVGFRERESLLLVQALEQGPAVIACGGGAVIRMFNRLQLRERAWCLYLTSAIHVLAERLAADTANPRPLLADELPERLAVMVGERRALYSSLANWTIHTDTLAPEQVAEDALAAWRRSGSHDPARVTVHGGSYRVLTRPLATLPAELDALGLHGTCFLISDAEVAPRYAPALQAALAQSGRQVHSFAVPSGEQSKDLSVAGELYSWLLEHGVQRGDTLLALGGGVVGDLAGFVAATILRGVAVVQLPTTILAMIDSSIGGKTGVNHPRGKNLIGAFHQPRLVLIDPATLPTLPRRERAAGWAEAVKHGVIADAALFADLEAHGAALLDLPPATPELLFRAAQVKIGVVNRDEREQHERMLLNYGHTLGQAVEAATSYSRFLHGEAVAIGMTFAALLARRRGLFDDAALERQSALLKALELPTALPADIDRERLLAALNLDKKRAAGRLRWILPSTIGAAAVYDDVPPAEVVATLDAWPPA